MLKGQLGGSIFFNELVQESIIKRVLWPDKNIFLSIVEFFPRFQDLALPLADELLHFLVRQIIRQRVQQTLDLTHTVYFARDFRCLAVVLLLKICGTHVPDPERNQQNENTRNPKTMLTNDGELSFQLIHDSSLRKWLTNSA